MGDEAAHPGNRGEPWLLSKTARSSSFCHESDLLGFVPMLKLRQTGKVRPGEQLRLPQPHVLSGVITIW